MPRSLSLFVHTAAPNTALVKSSGKKEVQVVIGGRMLAIPVMQRVDRLSLALRTITVRTANGLTINGVAVNVESACQIKIQGWSSGSEGMAQDEASKHVSTDLHMDISAVRLAAQHFLGKTDEQIEETISRTVSGHQRAIIGSLTVEQLYRDRATFCKRVLDLISADMRNMGLTVVSYTVAEINDANGYIDALGVTQTEKVKREAVEGAAENRAAAKSHSAREEARAHLEVNTQMKRKIESDRERAIAEALAQETIMKQRAIEAKAHAISTAEQDAILLVKLQQAKAKETEAELAVMKQQVERERLIKQRQINVESDALLYQARVQADAHRASAMAESERITLVGQAEADAIKAKGLAEAEILRGRIEAWQRAPSGGALMERLIERLPEVAKAISAPLAKTEKMVFVGTGGQGGPSQFVSDLNRVVAEVPHTVKAITGLDVVESMKKLGCSTAGSSLLQGAGEGFSAAIAETLVRRRSIK